MNTKPKISAAVKARARRSQQDNRRRKKNQDKPSPDFQLIKAIRGKKQKGNDGEPQLYKANIYRRDTKVRKIVEKDIRPAGRQWLFPGQLVMFNYLQPKTEPQLKYYDAMPCTIFFGVIKTKDGPRVLGFNIHYYPPPMRYKLLDRIFEIFKPIYLESWSHPLTEELPDFNYKMLIYQLKKAKLEFGIREYIPSLMTKVRPIPIHMWQKVVFTEGCFKKETRQQILNYWKQKAISTETPKGPII